MSTAQERAAQLELVARLKSAYPELPDAPTPDLIDHDRFYAYMKTNHDVGGEPDAPMNYENKQYELWEHMTYVMCEVLALAGDLVVRRTSPHRQCRRRAGGLPRIPVLRSLAAGRRTRAGGKASHRPERTQRTDGRGKTRYADGLHGKSWRPSRKFEGDGSQVKRNAHHQHAVGKGDPQVYAGQAGQPSSKSATRSWCGICPPCFIPAPRSIARRHGRDRCRRIRKPRRRGRDVGPARRAAGMVLHRSVQPLRVMARLHRDPATDTLQTEIPERWLEAAS